MWFNFFLYRKPPMTILFFYNLHCRILGRKSKSGLEHQLILLSDFSWLAFFSISTLVIPNISILSRPNQIQYQQPTPMLLPSFNVTDVILVLAVQRWKYVFWFRRAHLYGGHMFKSAIPLEEGRRVKEFYKFWNFLWRKINTRVT